MLVCLTKQVQVDETPVDLVLAGRHPARIVHIVSLPVTKLRVSTSLVKVIRLTYGQLAHLVHEL